MKVPKFGSVWCSGCLTMKPRWQEIENENPWLKTKYCDFINDKKMFEKYKPDKIYLHPISLIKKEFPHLHGEICNKKLLETIKENSKR